jgi:hypothetical protein|tara:strand:+ start:6498 stop:6710 length:213 start_codon:yes stop_codon:yes gene_type:complete
MVKKVYEAEDLNPDGLERTLGLPKGTIKKVSVDAEGWVEIDYTKPPTEALEDSVKAELAKHGLPRGKGNG